MSSVQTIEVHTAPAYEVTIGAGLLRDCGARLKAVLLTILKQQLLRPGGNQW